MDVDNRAETVRRINPQSYWLESTGKTDYPALDEDLQTDVAVIGGGIAGISAAYLLKQEGLRVTVLEADVIVQGTTGHTTAKISSQHGLIYDKLKKTLGLEKARMYAESNESAIGLIEELALKKKIDCDFERLPAYVYTESQKYVSQVAAEAKLAAELGIAAEYTGEIPLPIQVKGAVRFDNQAQFHPRKFLLALAAEIPGGGSAIYEKTRIVDLTGDNPVTVIARSGRKVKAAKVIVASHYPFYDRPGLYFARTYPERSYVLAVTIKESFPQGMFINAESPTRSLRAQKLPNGELILAGGESHKTGHGKSTLTHYVNLSAFAAQTFTVKKQLYRWSAQDYITLDSVPFAGLLAPTTPNIYVSTGFGKWGMTGATAAALLIRDLVISGKSPWLPLYNPSRLTPRASAASLIRDSVDVAVDFTAGRVVPAPVLGELEPGEGKVVKTDGRRAGAYRDAKGKLHLVDTTCPHLKCKLNWNDAETTWDCPCHGSRFSVEGEIVEGPALSPLPKLTQD